MKLSKLERASDYQVKEWLEKSLKLTDYQKSVIYNDEIIRFSPFYFYKRRKENKVPILWRFTLIFVPPYIILLYIMLPFKWLITGEWGYGQDFLDKFHFPWMNKLNL